VLPGLRPKAGSTDTKTFRFGASAPRLAQRGDKPKRFAHRRGTNQKQNVGMRMPALLTVCYLESGDRAGEALRSIAIRAMLPPGTESLTLTVEKPGQVIIDLMRRR